MANELLTDAELAALREIEQRATPGPWIHGDRFDGPNGDTGGGYANDAVLAMPDLRAVLGPSCRSGADARLIAAIRNAAPAILASAEEAALLRAEVDTLDARATAVRVALDAAGIPAVEAYPAEEDLSQYERSLRAGGRCVPDAERVKLLALQRDAARASLAVREMVSAPMQKWLIEIGKTTNFYDDDDSAGMTLSAWVTKQWAALRAEVARLEALFQQTHGVHHDWVAQAEKLRQACERKDAVLDALSSAIDNCAAGPHERHMADEEVGKR